MRKTLLLTFALLMGILLSAQTQQGYVKTKGRMVDGKLVPGHGLKGASVSVHGRNTILVNSNDGAFSFAVPNVQFRVDSVRKKGYQLVDADAIGKTYGHSSNPLYLVMETPEQQLQDQLDAERRLRRTLTRQLHEREDEIEALKEQQKLTDEEYRQALQKLYDDVDQNEQLVKDMVERYSKIDYDQMSEFDRQISELILNGELTKADSMLRTKGDINQRVENYRKHEAVNAKEQAELAERQEQLEKSQALALKERDDLANDCYRKFEIFKMQHQNDSAAYYIELRAELDTTNVDWLLDAGNFICNYCTDPSIALFWYNSAINNSIVQYGYGNATADCYSCIATCYINLGEYDLAMDYINHAISITKIDNEKDIAFSAKLYSILGGVYNSIGNDSLSFKCHMEDFRLQESLSEKDSLDLATTYNNLGGYYVKTGDYESALGYYSKCLEIRERLAKNTIYHSTILNNMGVLMSKLGNDTLSLSYYIDALRITNELLGEHHIQTASSFNNVGSAYIRLKNYKKGVEYLGKSLLIHEKILGNDNPEVAIIYGNYGFANFLLGNYETANQYILKSLSIKEKVYGENHPRNINTLYNLAESISASGDLTTALMYYNKALNIQLSISDEQNPKVIKMKNRISEIEAKLKEQQVNEQ